MILKSKKIILSKWVNLSVKSIKKNGEIEKFHSFSQADYVCTIGLTKENKIPLVRQYRIAVEKKTLELPGGFVDKNETIVSASKRELYEETGYIAITKPYYLGVLMPDTGRIENKMHCFFINKIKYDKNFKGELGISSTLLSLSKLKNYIINQKLLHSLHISAIFLAVLKKKLNLNE
jgi:ADP-ribose pyrophosphatase